MNYKEEWQEFIKENQLDTEIELSGRITNMLPINTPKWISARSWRIVIEDPKTDTEVLVYVPDNKHFYESCYMNHYLKKGSYYTGNILLKINAVWFEGVMMALEIIDKQDDSLIYTQQHPDAAEARE